MSLDFFRTTGLKREVFLFQPAAVLHEPPRRILVRLPLAPVCISDYLFPGETPYDSNDSVEEIFGFKPSIEDFDDELEIVASPGEAMVGYCVEGNSLEVH